MTRHEPAPLRTSETGRGPILWLVALVALLPLLGFWAYGLFDLDEGYYAAVVAEMIRSNDWITPHYNGLPWYEKPVLTYWLAAPFVWALGENWGPRLGSVLSMLGLYAALYGFAKRRVGWSVGVWAVLVASSSLLLVGIGRMLMPDAPLVLFLSLSLLTWFESLSKPLPWRAWSGLSLGLAVLAKGPVALALFGLVVAATYLREPELRKGYRGGWMAWALLLVATVGSWYVPAYLANPNEFVQKFLVEQNLERFAGGDEAHRVGGVFGLLFYVPVLLLGMFPWSLWIPIAWPLRSRVTGEQGAFLRFCAVWAVVTVGLFTLSGSKLPHYVAPALPPLAILVAAHFAHRYNATARVLAWPIAWACAVAVLANGAFWTYYHRFHADVHALVRYARQRGGRLAAYQLPRRSRDLGTGTLEVQETSHPSLVFYWNGPVLEAERLDELIARPEALWVVTRPGRLTDRDFQTLREKGWTAVQVEGVVPPSHYLLYRFIPPQG